MESPSDVRIAATAKLLADDSRAAICAALLDGRARTASELAALAGVAPSTASEHLSKLVAGGLLATVRAGRHNYFEIANSEVAHALESLAVVSPRFEVRSLRQHAGGRALRQARTCYDHLAGRFGVALTEALIDRGVITQSFGLGDLTPLAPLGIQLPANSRRDPVRRCLDWTERRYHAAGALPAEIARQLTARGWVERTQHGRAVRVTGEGQRKLTSLLGQAVAQVEADD